MAIITLTSDYGKKDYFNAAIKGAILSQSPEIKIVDISHEISPFNIQEAAYILKNAYHHFPKRTIHIIGIDSEAIKEKNHIICVYNNHYFIGADTGIFSLMFPNIKAEQIIALNIAQESDSIAFPMKDVFVKAACHINRGGSINIIGRHINNLKEAKDFQPTLSIDKKIIKGQIIYIDHYGNLISNITETFFNKSVAGKKFEIILPRKNIINSIKKIYSQAIEGEMLALFNSAGHLEIAINKGDSNLKNGASGLLGIKVKDSINIEFYDS